MAGDLISDHHVITCRLTIPPPPRVTQTVTLRKINDIDMREFRLDIANYKLTKLDGETLETLVNVYNEELTKLMDKHAPVTTERVKKQRKEP